MTEKEGYHERGEFDENDEFGKIDNLTKFTWKDLDLTE